MGVWVWLAWFGCASGPEGRAEAASLPGAAEAVVPTPRAEGAPWPALEWALLRRPVRVERGRRLKVYLDPGHGAKGNPGNTSAACVAEQDHTVHVAEAVAAALRASGRAEVRLARGAGELKGYARRVEEANAWKADYFLSFHSDARGHFWRGENGCPHSDGGPGFSVLYNGSSLAEARRRLATSVSAALSAGGLPAYNEGYAEGYDNNEAAIGVYRDRRGLMVLRRPNMPSVIIETHNALHVEEHARWTHDPEVLASFVEGVSLALVGAPMPP